MRKIFAIILVLFVGACTTEQTSEDIKNQIFDYKEEIAKLEKKLNADTSNVDASKVLKIRIVEMQKQEAVHKFKVTGAAEADKLAYISPEMNGQIKSIKVQEGQYVRKGTLLITLNADVIRNNIKEIQSGLDFATVMFKKQENLWKQKVGKEIDYLQAKNTKESLEAKLQTLRSQLRMSEIRAPFDGIVDEIYGKPGELATPGRQIILFVNLKVLKISADVSERYLPYIKVNDAVEVKFPSFPNIVVNTKVSRIGNVVNPANRTFTVEIKMLNPSNKIKPNMIAEAELSDYNGNNYMLPSIIVKTDKHGEFVYVVENKNGNSFAKKTYIKTGVVIGNKTVIESGLNDGDKVVIEGYSLIKNNSKVQIVK